MIAVQRIGTETARRVERAGDARVGLAAAVVAEVDRQVAGGRHRQDDDLRDERAARERELDVEAPRAVVSVASQTPSPPTIGTIAHQTLCTAESVTSADQDHPDDRQPSAVDLDAREAVGQQDGRPDHRRPTQLVPAREVVGEPPEGRHGLDDVVLVVFLQPDDEGGRRPRRVDERTRGRAGAA